MSDDGGWLCLAFLVLLMIGTIMEGIVDIARVVMGDKSNEGKQ